MKHALPFFCFGLLMMASACTPQNNDSIDTEINDSATNTQEYLNAAVLFVQHSAEYDALCYQAYNAAKIQLQRMVDERGDQLAVVLDLDETVLDNSAYSAWQVHSNNPYSTETWALWTDMASAPEVPGAGDFLRFADSLGVILFYISNRDTSALEATIQNMRDLKMPQLNTEQFMLKTNTSGKEDRRSKVESMGYEIAMLIGDNLGDFHETWDRQDVETRQSLATISKDHFGIKYIVLPNPIYGTWEGALYDYDRSLSNAQRDSLRNAWLQPAALQAN